MCIYVEIKKIARPNQLEKKKSSQFEHCVFFLFLEKKGEECLDFVNKKKMNCSHKEDIARQIELYTYPVLLVIGTLGNLLSLVVLIQMRQHSVYRYLTFMSIADTIVLYIGLLRELLLSSSLQTHIQGTLLCKLHVFFF